MRSDQNSSKNGATSFYLQIKIGYSTWLLCLSYRAYAYSTQSVSFFALLLLFESKRFFSSLNGKDKSTLKMGHCFLSSRMAEPPGWVVECPACRWSTISTKELWNCVGFLHALSSPKRYAIKGGLHTHPHTHARARALKRFQDSTSLAFPFLKIPSTRCRHIHIVSTKMTNHHTTPHWPLFWLNCGLLFLFLVRFWPVLATLCSVCNGTLLLLRRPFYACRR